MSEMTRRAWDALGLAEALFAIVYPVGVLLAMRVPPADTSDGWADLALFATFLVFGFFAVIIAVPIAVHTVGRLTERFVVDWSLTWAAIAHLVVGLVVGALAAVLLAVVGPSPLQATAVALVPTSGLVAFGVHLLMPLALRYRWIRIASWVISAVPVAAALASVALLTLRNF